MRYLFASTLMAVMLAAGCSGNSSEVHQSPSGTPTTSGVKTLKGKLRTSQYEFAPKWIPVQAAPRFQERQSLTAENTWPKDGDEVEVVCKKIGEPYPHPTDPASSLEEWYQIKIPNSPSVGYIESFWVKMSSDVNNC